MKHKEYNVVPLGNKIVVRREDADEITKGGIIIPDTAKEKPRMGTVLAVGEGGYNDKGVLIPMNIVEGQKVLFSAYSGNAVTINGEELLLMAQEEILARLEE